VISGPHKIDEHNKGHFILWLLVERTKDFSNLIGKEQKFVC
jgi:hypothetical protein